MNILLVLCIIGLVICTLGLLVCWYHWVRNDRVYAFRRYVLNLSVDAYEKLPDYHKMLYKRFDRLRLENYFTPEEVEILKSAGK